MHVAQPDDFERRGLDTRIILTRSTSLSEPSAALVDSGSARIPRSIRWHLVCLMLAWAVWEGILQRPSLRCVSRVCSMWAKIDELLLGTPETP
eukprot:3119448-Amphidinium_carterae.1